ncbi:MAG: type VII secretion protein EccCa, partial [Nakamurella sp.]
MTFRRPARREPPPIVIRQVDVHSPPALPERQPGGISTWLMVLPALGGLGAMALIFTAGGSGAHIAAGVMFGVSTLAMAGGQLARVGGDRSRKIAAERRDYLRHLAQIRRKARSAAADQAEALYWLHPDPRGLQSLSRTSRLWERRPADPDFATVRLGLGDQALALDLQLGEVKPLEDVDVVSAVALRRFLRTHGTVRQLPVALSMRSFARVRLEGNPIACRRMAAAMVMQAITWHAPADFRIALCVRDQGLTAWDWLKWAPHLTDPAGAPTDLPRFTVADTLVALEDLLSDELAGRPWAAPNSDPLVDRSHILVIVDGGTSGEGSQLAAAHGLAGVTVLDLTGALTEPPAGRALRLRVVETDVLGVTVDRVGQEILSHIGTPDQIDPAEAAVTSRAIAAVRMPEVTDAEQSLTTSTGLTDLIGVANIRTLNPSVSWRPRAARDRLRVAIGVGTTGQAVELDIKEAAQGGMGPHGLVVGATGSGKSELLRTLVLGLAITHPPESLNFVLVDFKGGATFNKLDALPHTSAVITNLSDELDLVDRMRDAMSGELNRRMELLRSAGSFASLRDYDQAITEGAPLAALPTLLIVVDEFSELLAAKPDFLDLFITIGRVGRSLGVHLLLASQRLEEGRLRGLDTYLSYRIGLKTFSVAESRIVLGAADAFELPTAPGNGYLKFDTTGLVRFKGAYVSGPVRDSRVGATDLGWIEPQPFRLTSAPGRASSAPAGERSADQTPAGSSEHTPADGSDPTGGQSAPTRRVPAKSAHTPSGQTLLEVAVARLAGSGVPAHEVWLPPLREPPTLDLLLPNSSLRGSPDDAISVPAASFLQVPLGWVDKPFDQTRGLLTIDMSGAAGNVAIVGGPQSGKSTALRSLLCALALTHTPAELQLYCLDFGGGSLGSLADLPHIGVVAGRLQPELVRRTVAMVNRILNKREQAFTAAGISSLSEWREQVAARTVIGDDFGDIILVVDGWGALREFFEPLEAQLTSLATRGLNYGVHLVVTAGRWPEIRAALKDMIGSRIELRLGDPLDSEINAKLAVGVPAGRPGRGLSRDRLHLLTAVPRIDGNPTNAGLAAATAELVRSVADRWTGPPAPRVKLLPAVVRSTDLPADLDPELGYPLGLDEDLQPVLWNPATDQHLLIFGEEQSGKSTLLRNLIRQISARHGLDGARFIVFDARRRLLDLPYRPDQLIASATNGRDAAGVIGANVERLQNRLPAPGMSRDEIGNRAWWGSPADIYLIIDNYERLAASAPLTALLPLLDHAADIALH